MIKRSPCQIAVLFVFGILSVKGALFWQTDASRNFGILLALLSCAAALVLTGIWISRESQWKKRLLRAAVLLSAIGIGMFRMHSVSKEMEQRLNGIEDGQNMSVQGRIIKKQRKDSFDTVQWVVSLTDTYLKNSNGIHFCKNVIVYLKDDEPVIGNTIVLLGKIKLFQEARNDGNFDERAYYQNQGYSLKIYADDDSYQAVDTHKDQLRELLYDIQQMLMRVYEQRMPVQEAGTLCAMLLGEKSLLSGETKELYRQSGISHILAISGLHISILGASIYQLLRKRGVPYVAASAVAMGLLVMFALMTGMGLSAVRAVAMFGIYLGAECCGRAYDSVNGLAAAGVCILAVQPCALFLAGFQFSFAAVAGVLFGKEVCRVFQPKFKLTQTILISAGIQLMTLPLTAWYYFEVPVYSILLNLIVLPLMEVVLITGLFGGIFGLAALPGSVFGTAALFDGVFCMGPLFDRIFNLAMLGSRMISGGFLKVCAFVLGYFTKAGELFLELPGAVCVLGQPEGWQMLLYYSVVAGCVWIIWQADERSGRIDVKDGLALNPLKEREAMSKEREIMLKKQEDMTKGRKDMPKKQGVMLKKLRIVICACFFVCLCILFLSLPSQPEVVVLDVGQGDGIYIHTSDGMNIFVDGGSLNVKSVGTYRILPFLKSKGVSCIDRWFVSHLDKDHISGLEEIVESGYDVGSVMLAKGILRDEAYEEMINLLEKWKIPVQYMDMGDRLRGRNACFTCLGPHEQTLTTDRNAGSMLLLYEDCGFCGFFSGDISADEEKKLLSEQKLSGVSFYKSAHHGSNYSNSYDFLRLLNPAVSVVSCAEKNDYGHPGREAVRNMEENSGSVYYTMHSGQIRICW